MNPRRQEESCRESGRDSSLRTATCSSNHFLKNGSNPPNLNNCPGGLSGGYGSPTISLCLVKFLTRPVSKSTSTRSPSSANLEIPGHINTGNPIFTAFR